jgi:hypothetical protein
MVEDIRHGEEACSDNEVDGHDEGGQHSNFLNFFLRIV